MGGKGLYVGIYFSPRTLRRNLKTNFTTELAVDNYVHNFKNGTYNSIIMQWQEWIPLTVGIITIITAIGAFVRYVIKNYLRQELHVIKHELQPNSGSSMKDQVTRLEANQKAITETQKEDSKRFDQKLDKLEDKVDKMFEIIIKHFGSH
jgi:hypothetical protein